MPATRLPPSALRWQVPEGVLDFETTASVPPEHAIIGQELGLAALRRGVELPSVGFNVFVVGLDSTGRLGTVRRILGDLDLRRRTARDFVYVRNFREQARPRLLVFPPGRGQAFRKDLLRAAARLLDEVPAILRSTELQRARDRQEETAAIAHHGALHALEAEAEKLGFALAEAAAEDGTTRPVVVWIEPRRRRGQEAKVHGRAEVQVLAAAGKLKLPVPLDETMARFDLLEEKLAAAMAMTREAVTTTVRKLAEAEEAAVREDTQALFQALAKAHPAAREWLAELHDELVESPEWFDEEEPDQDALFEAFTVNVVHSGSRGKKAPVVVVANPTWHMLLGGIEGEPGSVDHRSIRGGALLDADGGFLVLNASDLLQEPGAWKALKRALTYGAFDIQNPELPGAGGLVVLRPEAMRLDVRVVLVGDHPAYALMYYGDPDFASTFKIKAEFEEDTPATPAVLRQYTGFLARVVAAEHLPHLTAEAVGEVLGWGVRQAGRGGRITTHFGSLSDVVREAAVESRGRKIEASHVRAALLARSTRDGLPERRVHESISLRHLRVETQGTRVGQVNGLAVYHVGGHDFGRALRITATVGIGRGGVVSIEREAGLSGKAHDKGVQILGGLLRARFGQTRLLAFTASVAFEQSYGRIDGDSASTAEAYALCSALAGVPLRQDIAVTGSVNQAGEVQSIGGVNEKIEGFYAACRIQGFTGAQGALIPATNARDLNLTAEVADACRDGKFHVYTAETFEEGLELLSGVPWATLAERIGETLDRYQELSRGKAGKSA